MTSSRIENGKVSIQHAQSTNFGLLVSLIGSKKSDIELTPGSTLEIPPKTEFIVRNPGTRVARVEVKVFRVQR